MALMAVMEYKDHRDNVGYEEILDRKVRKERKDYKEFLAGMAQGVLKDLLVSRVKRGREE